MTEQRKQGEPQQSRDAAATQRQAGGHQSGDPGRTPGSAEGDRETVEESLRDKERKGQG